MTIRLRAAAAASITTTGDWRDRPTHGTIWIGTRWLDEAAINPALTETPENNDVLRVIDEGAPFDLEITGAGEDAIAAILSAGVDEVSARVRLHDGAPGATHTDNEIEVAHNPGYGPIALTLEVAVV